MIIQVGIPCKLINDSKCLLLEHFDAIQNSPSQIYHFALPLSPSSSWLCKCYSAELSLKVKVVKGLSAEWGPCSRTVSHGLYNTSPLMLESIKLQLDHGMGKSSFLMQLQAAKQQFFLGILVWSGL
jgi:hypothetical protein